jgi:hypothetical protein
LPFHPENGKKIKPRRLIRGYAEKPENRLVNQLRLPSFRLSFPEDPILPCYKHIVQNIQAILNNNMGEFLDVISSVFNKPPYFISAGCVGDAVCAGYAADCHETRASPVCSAFSPGPSSVLVRFAFSPGPSSVPVRSAFSPGSSSDKTTSTPAM